jgi:hypothetical protein
MPELGTAWINVTVKTGGMEDNIKRALRNVEKAAKLSPDVDTSKTSAKATVLPQRQSGPRRGHLEVVGEGHRSRPGFR